MTTNEDFSEFDNYNWSNDTLLTVIECAQRGVPTAIEEYEKRRKQLDLPPLDTISGNS